MDHCRFEYHFDQEFARPLSEIGFDFVGRGRSLRYLNGPKELRIIRLGGRMARPGAIVSVIGFRHTFLRPVASDNSDETNLSVSDFSRKLTFADFEGKLERQLVYRPDNLGHWRRDVFRYGDCSEEDVLGRLRYVRELVTTRIVPWADRRAAADELAQIRQFGEDAWCERRWIADYEAFLGGR